MGRGATTTSGTNQVKPPVAKDDSATVAPGKSVTIDVLANDSDPEGGRSQSRA